MCCGLERTSLAPTKKQHVLPYLWTPNRLFMFHGLQDENVHFHNSASLIEALLEKGKHYQLQVYPRDRHGIRNSASAVHYFSSVTSIFDQYL
eukprot:m.244181 g.244181  ORF g.244181 m.244181 type:complete len:92 (-) comp19467_c0_seq12:246-521(-)